jgi:hypothetical protein
MMINSHKVTHPGSSSIDLSLDDFVLPMQNFSTIFVHPDATGKPTRFDSSEEGSPSPSSEEESEDDGAKEEHEEQKSKRGQGRKGKGKAKPQKKKVVGHIQKDHIKIKNGLIGLVCIYYLFRSID